MALQFASVPANAVALVRAGLDKVAARSQPPERLLALGSGETSISAPHPVFDLRADEIARGGGLETARETALRFLITAGKTPLGAAELRSEPSGAQLQLSNLNFGPYADATAETLNRLASDEHLALGSYEVRLLRFSAIYLVAIWLKGSAGVSDIIIPLAPAPSPLVPDRIYGADELLLAIRPLAVERTGNGPEAAMP